MVVSRYKETKKLAIVIKGASHDKEMDVTTSSSLLFWQLTRTGGARFLYLEK